MRWHASICLTSSAHHGCFRIIPQVEARIDWNAVAADGDTWLVDVAKWLRVRCRNHFGNIDIRTFGEDCKLICEGDIYIAIGRLCKLCHLGSFRCHKVPDAIWLGEIWAIIEVEYCFIEFNAVLGALLIDSADKLWILAKVGEDATSKNTFRREDEGEICACAKARDLLKCGCETVPSSSHWESGLVGDESSRLETLCNSDRCFIHPAKVRDSIVIDEEWNDDDYGIGFSDC